MNNLWHQIRSRWFTWVLLCTLGVGIVLVSVSAYVAGKDDSTRGELQMATAAGRDLPLIDQKVVAPTESALFALG